jgi:hypothetical protein
LIDTHPERKDNVKQYCRGWFKDGSRTAQDQDLSWGKAVPCRTMVEGFLRLARAPIGHISTGGPRPDDLKGWRKWWQDPRRA